MFEFYFASRISLSLGITKQVCFCARLNVQFFFPLCEARLSFSGRAGRFSCKYRTEDKWRLRQVWSQVKNGIPKFWRHEKICGGSRAQTQTESVAALAVPPVRSNFAQKNVTCRDSMLTGEKTFLKDFLNFNKD